MGTSLERSSALQHLSGRARRRFCDRLGHLQWRRHLRGPRQDPDRHRSRAQTIAADGSRDRHLSLLRTLRRRRQSTRFTAREEEIERYKQNHDPIRLWKARLISEGLLSEEKYDELDREARKRSGGKRQVRGGQSAPRGCAISPRMSISRSIARLPLAAPGNISSTTKFRHLYLTRLSRLESYHA